MEIKRIVVDELPKSCRSCNLSNISYCGYWKCAVLPDYKDGIKVYNRLSIIKPFDDYKRPDCPLVVEE